jgi:hypothetical protein
VQDLIASPRAVPRKLSRARGERREAALLAAARSLADRPASADDADVVFAGELGWARSHAADPFAGGHGVISSGSPLEGEEAVARLLSRKTGTGIPRRFT